MHDPLSCVGARVLVVGGSSGIGNGIAHAFLERGAEVSVWGTRLNASDYVGEKGSDLSGLHYACVDVSDHAAIAREAAFFDRLDVLVLSQGTVLYKRAEFEMEGFQQVIEVNLNSVMACAIAFKHLLAATKGSLIVISSIAAFVATRGNPAYSASKAGTLGLVRTLAEAWAPIGVRVNGIAPGMIATKLTKVTTSHPERLTEMVQQIPLGRLGEPEDIAGVALFLASPLAAYVVGEMIKVDGGKTLS